MTRPIPSIAVDFIAQHEACALKAYPDTANVWTIGYGSTDPAVKQGDVCTPEVAKARLAVDLQTAASRLSARIGSVVDEITEHQYAALLSFVFNVGAGPGWTIWKRLKARQFDQIPLELMKFVNAGGKKVNGLVNRRADECKLWATGEPGSVPMTLASSETRAMDTPPTPADPTPPHRSATVITGALTVVSTVPVAAKTVSDAVAPYKDASPMIGQAIAIIATIAAAAAVLVLVLTWLKKRADRK